MREREREARDDGRQGNGTRYRVTVMAGVSAMAHDVRSSGFWDDLGTNGAVVVHRDLSERYTEYWPGLSVGVDATLRLTSALALVPQIRTHMRLDSLSSATFPFLIASGAARHRIALRWTF